MTPAASDLGNITWGAWALFCLAGGAAIVVLGCGLGAAAIWIWQATRARAGISGHGHLRQAAADADRENLPVTRAMALGDLVISAEGERLLQARSAALTPDALTQAIAWCGFCDDLTAVGDPAACGCEGACGRAWCPRRRSPVPVTWTEREEGVR